MSEKFLAQPRFSLKGRKWSTCYKSIDYFKYAVFVLSPSEPKSKGIILYQCLTIRRGEEVTNFATRVLNSPSKRGVNFIFFLDWSLSLSLFWSVHVYLK